MDDTYADLDPKFTVASLQLARAYDQLGDVGSAQRSYTRTLRLAGNADDPTTRLYDRVGVSDVHDLRLRAYLRQGRRPTKSKGTASGYPSAKTPCYPSSSASSASGSSAP
jgi:hypothetical protein